MYWAFYILLDDLSSRAAQSFLSLNMIQDIISFPIFGINFLEKLRAEEKFYYTFHLFFLYIEASSFRLYYQ